MSKEYYSTVFRLPLDGTSYGLRIEPGRIDLLTGEELSTPDPSSYEISLLVIYPDGKVLTPPSDAPFFFRHTDRLPSGKSHINVLLKKAEEARRRFPDVDITTLMFNDRIVLKDGTLQ